MPKANAPAAPAATPTPAQEGAQPVAEKPVMFRGIDVSKIFTKEPGDEPRPLPSEEGDEEDPEKPKDEAAPGEESDGDEPAEPKGKPKAAAKSIAEQLAAKAGVKNGEPLSKSFLELTKKEQKLAQRARELDEREAKLKGVDPEAAVKDFEADPFGWLEKRGYGYEKLTDMVVNGKKPDPAAVRAMNEIKASQKKIEEDLRKRDEDLVRREQEAQIAQFRADVRQTVVAGAEKYELINTLGKVDMVEDVIRSYARETGQVVDYDLAAEFVEAQLEEEAAKALKTKKLSAKIPSPAAPAHQPSSGRPSANPAPKPRTLTNASAAAAAGPSKPLTREERLRNAAAAIRFKD
jgi:hypothetical protein